MEGAIAVAIAWDLDGVRKPTFRLLASGKAGGSQASNPTTDL